ncbi:MSHA biogenesis protein MshF [Vibrio anguillarum]|uniref:MSHA biogenesis protein MshF n=1 Tax=Vibrio anguillarum TaxID=55601 RepID=UPI00097E29FF|nr:MSHA biogenesis protein MshF [Vibrio anguillarum]AXN04836.1 MSHA biogenesis protein MshF [Vibrio anguillarum]MBT2912819.1 MSHA biogenesis protein MshF [Vibrio anguillarum]OQQ12212.1 MSHA biogenesis protein MshF [Vibrio anguillarum]
MKTAIERSQFVIWGLIVFVLLMALLSAWQSIEKEANQTALAMASSKIVESANFYKQDWLLKGRPSTLIANGRLLNMSATGWVLPLAANESSINCRYWLSLLYPDEQLLESKVISIESAHQANLYQCRYVYSQKQVITIELLRDKFTVSVDFSA